MRIGELAEHARVSTKTVRYYESIGLVPPPARTASGYREYGADSVERLTFIRESQRAGLSLTEIASILELKDQGRRSCEHTRDLVRRHIGEIDDQIERLLATRRELLVLAERAESVDPADCTDPHRCQVITGVTSGV